MSFINDFHLLRPFALLALLPLLAALIGLWYSKHSATDWQAVIAAKLLPYLTEDKTRSGSRGLLWGLAVFWLLASIALAGPTWERAPSHTHRSADALIILLDLSPSMVSQDIKPSRLVRARLKIAELLKRRDEGDTALIVYADQAHVVTPLTEDTATISALLPALHPGMMPAPGSRVEAAVSRAVKMLSDSGYSKGHLLLVTDGVAPSAEDAILKELTKGQYHLSILGIGSDKAVPIAAGKGGFIRDRQGNVITTSLESGRLQRLARRAGGRYITSTFDTSDLEYLLTPETDSAASQYKVSDNKMDTWVDRGPWLVMILLPLALIAFRKGVLTLVLLATATGLLHPSPALAESTLMDKLLLTPDQRGAKAMKNQQPEVAAQAFNDPAWRGVAQYRAGQYEQAAETFATINTAQGHYNRGNALARQGKFDEAIAAYDKALQMQPDMQEAAANKALIEQMKKQQEAQNQQNQSKQDASEQDNNPDNQQEQQNQQSDQQNTDRDSENREQQSQSSRQSSGSTQQPQDSQAEQNSAQGHSESSSSSAAEQENQQASSAQSSSESAAQQTSSAGSDGKEQNLAAQEPVLSAEEKEQQQAQEQWLRKIPDDPSGLLRNKFQYEYRQNRNNRQFKDLNNYGDEEQRW